MARSSPDWLWLAIVLAIVLAAGCSAPSESSVRAPEPRVAVGPDAYLDLLQLYRPKLGVRSFMRSTCDRSGGNEAADASHFLRSEADDFHVTLDVAGPGVLYFVRTNHWHGSPWHYVVDGQRFTVTESSTADPLNPISGSVFMPESSFPSPLTYTWSTTRGADLSWVPIAFERRLTLAYSRTHYGTGYYIYQQLPLGAANLSRPVRSFRGEAPGAAVLSLLERAGQDIAPQGADVDTVQGSLEVAAGQSASLPLLHGARVLRALKLRAARDQERALEEARLRIYWDGQSEPAVDAPVPLFFGTGTFYDRAQLGRLVQALLLSVELSDAELALASYFPMPFLRDARIELQAGAAALRGVRYELRSHQLHDPSDWVSYFHASYRDHPAPRAGEDLVLLDTAEAPAGQYCGTFVGTSFVFSERAELSTLEGDPRFFFDDSASPQAYGTGTEEWAGGGDYWGGQTMTLPLAGHPVGAPHPQLAHADPRDLIESAYRLLVADAMPFGKRARIQLEHGADNTSSEHYRTLVYWYGRPRPCLVQTDALHVGDAADERAHAYRSDTASEVQEIRSRYDLGVERLGPLELVPESVDSGRFMRGTSELSLRVHPDNQGVLLRRKLDYAWPNQRAQVFVAPEGSAEFQLAGEWYTAGGTRSVYSNPPGELDPPQLVVQESNRRFRDDELILSGSLTHGLSGLRVRIVFVPDDTPLTASEPRQPNAWSELSYSAYSWLLSP